MSVPGTSGGDADTGGACGGDDPESSRVVIADAVVVAGDGEDGAAVGAAGQRGCALVPPPPARPLTHSEVFDAYGKPRPEVIRDHFMRGGYLTCADATEIVLRTHAILRGEPNVLHLQDPVTVCGDVHGQFYDLMTLFRLGGDPNDQQYLFLGDYVDRGSFSTEVTLYIFALKLCRPQAMWLLRGNHECRHLTAYFNFREECLHKYSADVYEHFMTAFDALPLAALVGDCFLCLHGGLSPDIKCVDDITLIDRFREPPTSGAMCDLLWADPMEDEEERLCPDALYLHNELRGCSYIFSCAAVERFLKENDLLCIIRAHEAQDEGFRMYRKVEETGFPGVICVFSAPNYCDSYDNKAAILQIDKKVIHLRQYHCVEHPYVLPNFMNAFSWSLPFVADKLTDIITTVSGAGVGPSAPHEGGVAAAVPAPSAACSSSVGGGWSQQQQQQQQQRVRARDVTPHIFIRSAFLRRRGGVLHAKVFAAACFLAILRAKRRAKRASLARTPHHIQKKALQQLQQRQRHSDPHSRR